jgi:hypothetical protein
MCDVRKGAGFGVYQWHALWALRLGVCGAEEVEGGHEVCRWEDIWGEGVEGEDGGVGYGLMGWDGTKMVG